VFAFQLFCVDQFAFAPPPSQVFVAAAKSNPPTQQTHITITATHRVRMASAQSDRLTKGKVPLALPPTVLLCALIIKPVSCRPKIRRPHDATNVPWHAYIHSILAGTLRK